MGHVPPASQRGGVASATAHQVAGGPRCTLLVPSTCLPVSPSLLLCSYSWPPSWFCWLLAVAAMSLPLPAMPPRRRALRNPSHGKANPGAVPPARTRLNPRHRPLRSNRAPAPGQRRRTLPAEDNQEEPPAKPSSLRQRPPREANPGQPPAKPGSLPPQSPLRQPARQCRLPRPLAPRLAHPRGRRKWTGKP